MRVYLKTHKMELTTWWTLKTKSMKFNDRKNIACSGGLFLILLLKAKFFCRCCGALFCNLSFNKKLET